MNFHFHYSSTVLEYDRSQDVNVVLSIYCFHGIILNHMYKDTVRTQLYDVHGLTLNSMKHFMLTFQTKIKLVYLFSFTIDMLITSLVWMRLHLTQN